MGFRSVQSGLFRLNSSFAAHRFVGLRTISIGCNFMSMGLSMSHGFNGFRRIGLLPASTGCNAFCEP